MPICITNLSSCGCCTLCIARLSAAIVQVPSSSCTYHELESVMMMMMIIIIIIIIIIVQVGAAQQ